jgi:hypothetical protein
VAAKTRIFERLSRNDPPPANLSTPSSGAIPGCRLRRRWDPGYGTTRGWYSILAAEDGGIDIALHALDYDHAAAAGALRTVNSDLPYAETFETGLWPNMDVMPESERRERERPLAPGSVLWPEERIAAAE